MKADKVTVVSGQEGDETVLVLKKKKFPWWILLLLLPLLLLIPISRTVRLQIVQQNTLKPVTNTTTEFYYPEIGSFGAKVYVTQKKDTDGEGKVIYEGISEPLWYFLFDKFIGHTAKVTVHGGCLSGDGMDYPYHEFPRFTFKQIEIPEQEISVPVTVIDADTKEPIDNAKVEIIKTIDGNTTIDSLFTDSTGIIMLNSSLCAQINLIGYKEGYENDTLTGGADAIAQLNDTSRVLRLKPIFQGEGGDLRFNLQWYSKTDLDLHVIDPCGHEIFYERRQFTCGDGEGTLDVDANAKYNNRPYTFTTEPQENIFFVAPSKGEYKVKVMCFEKRGNTLAEEEFNVTIIDRKGHRQDFSGKVKHRQTVTVTTYTVE